MGMRHFDLRPARTELPESLHELTHSPLGDPRSSIMPVPDYPTRLRELADRCNRAARNSFEVEAIAAFRMIADGLANMAEEMEASAARKGDRVR
jgi:hypothetical protein